MTLRNYIVSYLIDRIKDADLKDVKTKSQLVTALCTTSICTEDEANQFAEHYFRTILDFISQFDVPDFGTNNVMLRDYILRYYGRIIIYSLNLPSNLDFNEKQLKNLLDSLLVG